MSERFVPPAQVAVPDIAYQEAVVLPATETAVIVVDMQNDFVKEGGTLVVNDAAATIPNIRQLLTAAREAGVHVVYTQDTHFEGDPEWALWPEHCRQGSWGWQIVDELRPREGDLVCQKNRYDGFYGTWLDHFLRLWGVRNVVIVGTVSSICVLHTAASAGLRWYKVVVPANGVSALTPFDQALTLRQVSWLYTGSVVRDVAEIRFVTDEG